MKKLYFFLLSFLTVTTGAFAHQLAIKGVVYSKSTNTPLAGATVSIPAIDKISTTDRFGVYTFHDLAAGNYELKITYLGFEQEKKMVEVNPLTPPVLATSYLSSGSLQLAEIAVSASQAETANIISAVDVQLRPIQNSQEILRLIPGLFIAQHAGGGKAEQIFLRGFDIDHGTDINLTADGMPVNMVSHAHGQGYSDLHFLIPEIIQNVDFGKGPYRADKGNFGTAGYADFRTRSALDKNSIKLEAGKFDNYRTVGMFNLLGARARQNQQNAYLATEYLFSNGYFQSPQGLNRLNLFSRYQGVFRNNTILSGSLSAFRSTWDASGQIPERAVADGTITRFGAIDDTEGGQTARYNANLSLDKTFTDGSYLKNQVYFVKYDFELYSNFTFFLNDPENGDQIRQKEKRQIYGYQGTHQKEATFMGRPLRQEVGIGLRYDDINGSELSRTRNRKTTLLAVQKGNIQELNTFAYLNQTWDVSTRFSVNAALRFDRLFFNYTSLLEADASRATQKSAASRVSPKLNFTYAVTQALQLYLSSGMSYHSNDSRVSVTAVRKEALPAARGADLGLKFKPVEQLYVNAALWFLDLDQEFVYVGDEGIVEPSGKTRRYGLDLSARYQFNKNLFLDTDLNLARPRARDEAKGNNFIPLAPAITSTGGLSYQTTQGLKANLRYRYLGHRPANEDNSLTAEGYFLADAVVSYTFKNLEFRVSGENLFNSNWKEAQFETESRLRNEIEPVSEIHFTPGTPFSVKAGVTFSF
ncbi:TonB-dependent receptor [Adhaeribacter aerolatus]|uniref:TonB-dependent receptor n=1 Tax=Adhaeribacter aerolatus TaxID=670289 RepID=A0A512B287_9BACT|nr:TonB-dependent receptor [Adhaeribacter aerolatus]GEO06059.1 TonB-dependent receptor [Adhaeribacter aerolatus]